MEDILAFARSRSMLDKCKIISLGQDQGQKTMKVLEDCIQMGHWVVLQNCHISGSWLDELERLFMNMESNETLTCHRDFRLWCTSESYEKFPIYILQNSVKMTNESPNGLKMSLQKIYNSDIIPREDIFNKNSLKLDQERDCHRVVLGMVLFHMVLLQRRQFGSIGWNYPYEFDESDLRLSVDQLLMFCKDSQTIPYGGHKFLTGQCYYGGRIVDENDRRLLLTLLDHLYKGECFEETSSIYKFPDCPNRVNTLVYISKLPDDSPPDLFGFHPNASFRKSIAETNNLITGTMVSQTELLVRFRQQQTEKQANRPSLLTMCESIAAKIPEQINLKFILDNIPPTGSNALNGVLYNETLQHNEICKYISKSIHELVRALKGEVSSTMELEHIQECLAKQVVPEKWTRQAFDTKKPLSGFIQDLVERMKFFKSWTEDGEPTTFWISAFLCPQAVFEALRWNASKRAKKPIEEIHLRISLTEFESKSRISCMKYSDFCRVRRI